MVDLDHPHLTPAPDPVHALVYGLQGNEVETVLCAGAVLMQDRELVTLNEPLPDLLSTAERTAADVVRRAEIE